MSYGRFFDSDVLRSELTVLLSDNEIHKDTVCKLYEYLLMQDTVDVFPKVSELAQLIITTPRSNFSAERSFSMLYQNISEKYPRTIMSIIIVASKDTETIINRPTSTTYFNGNVIDPVAEYYYAFCDKPH